MLRLLSALLAVSLFTPGLQAQFGAGDWTTTGFDAQRSHWLRGDPKISLESMRRPGFTFLWKVNVHQETGRHGFLTPPALLDFYIGYRGFRSLGFIGNSGNAVLTMDTDLGRVEWKTAFAPQPPQAAAGCPGGMTSAVARPTNLDYPIMLGVRGAGRATPAKSAVGEPFQGAAILKELARPQPAPPPPAPAKSGRRAAAPAANPFAPRIQWLYALSSDGKLHAMYVSNGEEPNDARTFLPPNAYAKGLLVSNNVAYVATTNNCGGVENGIWALDLESSRVQHWKAPGNIAGSAGFAVRPDGTILVAAGDQLVALEERTLRPIGAYTISGAQFNSSPVIFEYKGRDLAAVTSTDGKLHVLDTTALERPLAVSPAFFTNYNPGALATWRDVAGIRWILAPVDGSRALQAGFKGDVKNGAIVAWKLVDQDGKPTLQPGWISPDMISPLTPVVVNGVIFALSSGEARGASGAEKNKRSVPAVLYALDSADGRVLWNSGTTLTTYVPSHSGLSAGGSRVYVATEDGVQYAFGFPLEI
jgi:outer membrane protein assembly factor BamB